jgi:hypothetical protein
MNDGYRPDQDLTQPPAQQGPAEASAPMADFFTSHFVVDVKGYRFGGKTYEGEFKFKRLTMGEEHEVHVRRATATRGLEWYRFPPDAQESMTAKATMAVACVDVPDWYKYAPDKSVVTDGLVVRLFREYDTWVALSFQGMPSGGDGASGEPGLELHSCLRDLERRLAEGRRPAGGAA